MSVPTPSTNNKALAVRKKNELPAVIEDEKVYKLATTPGKINTIVLDKSKPFEEQAQEYFEDLNQLHSDTVDELGEYQKQLQEAYDKLYETPAGKKLAALEQDVEDCKTIIKEIPGLRMGALRFVKLMGIELKKKDVKSKLLKDFPSKKQLTGGTP